MIRRYFQAAKTAAVLIALLIVSAQARQQPDKPAIQIQNFGCVNEKLYRGAQPKATDYASLAALGIKTVIDLQREGEADEQQLVEDAGMKFFRIGMSDRSRPAPGQADEFFSIISDPANQPVFVHCHGGRHRTGVLIALYRITREGWTAERAYEEMKQYQFAKGIGHGALKQYVFDYYAQMEQKNSADRSAR
ncbi:MAG TPA: dual specificity protein phosphatase family protein [Blastocatellia bacterium]|nr:dual specificity protein phosphatase family protein [Blastocatellia bacterium]